jgi:predicted MFS family arabinose efflux permease
MLTQLGYAAGILLLAPLGDRFDRRRIVLIKATILLGALVAAAFSPTLATMLAASFAIGLSATLAQDAVSSAASLAAESNRGKVVGTVMSGLLLGILLSRVISGAVAELFGWRTTYFGAAFAIALCLGMAWRFLPSVPATTGLAYSSLLKSIGSLWRGHALLRRAALAQGLVSVGFSAFWSTLAMMLAEEPFHLGSSVAGAFGLAGAAGALVAPVAGRIADRHGPGIVTRLGTALTALSFGAMVLASFLTARFQLYVIAACVIGFDLGVQATLIAHQTIIYGIDPAARSRLNAALFTVMFLGMAVGAGLGTYLFEKWGWMGVVFLAFASSSAAFLVRLGTKSPEPVDS